MGRSGLTLTGGRGNYDELAVKTGHSFQQGDEVRNRRKSTGALRFRLTKQRSSRNCRRHHRESRRVRPFCSMEGGLKGLAEEEGG